MPLRIKTLLTVHQCAPTRIIATTQNIDHCMIMIICFARTVARHH